jgi:hypothetical protein
MRVSGQSYVVGQPAASSRRRTGAGSAAPLNSCSASHWMPGCAASAPPCAGAAPAVRRRGPAPARRNRRSSGSARRPACRACTPWRRGPSAPACRQRCRARAAAIRPAPTGAPPPSFRRESLDAEGPRQHALDVAVEDGRARAEGEHGDGGGGGAADARQGDRCPAMRAGSGRRALRRPPAPPAAGCAPARSSRGRSTAPSRPRPAPRRGGQIGKAGEEARVVGDHRRHLRLLQHDFGQPDAVGIARVLPGQVVAAVARVPGDQPPGEVLACRPSRSARLDAARLARLRASSVSPLATATPMRRLTKDSGLPNRRRSVRGTASASATPSKAMPASSMPP